jgi:hypothetical protein
MATYIGTVTRPATGSGTRARSLRKTGLMLGAIGFGIAALSLLASINAGSLTSSGAASDQVASSVVLAFGLAVAGFATIKLGIGIILLGIVRRLWVRVETVKVSLPALIVKRDASPIPIGEGESPYGPVSTTRDAPPVLRIHRMAQLLWAPMLVMGAMLVTIGLVVDIVAAANTGAAGTATSGFAWAQGLLFLGETALLAGISFLLGTILGAIRSGGGEVQRSVGVSVRTLQMPTTAKIFLGVMVAGVMVGMVQFVGYAIVALSGDSAATPQAFAVLGPLREFGLGLLLAGIVLALATIANVLGFLFSRITEIITCGRLATEVLTHDYICSDPRFRARVESQRTRRQPAPEARHATLETDAADGPDGLPHGPDRWLHPVGCHRRWLR